LPYYGSAPDLGAHEYQNKAPTANDDAYSVVQGNKLAVAAPGVLANDKDAENHTLTAALVNGPSSGDLSLDPDGSFTYEPNPGFTGTDSFTYKASDSFVDSNVATVTITVGEPNNPPMANDDNYSVDEGGTLNILAPGVLGNDNDADSDPLTAVVVIGGGPLNGILNINPDGSFSYTHDGGETISDGFAYQANDGKANSHVVSVSITINPVNDSPEANDVGASTLQDTKITINVIFNDFDVDGSIDPATVTITSGPANGSAVANIDGTVTYTPTPSFLGTDTFKYTVKDELGAASNEATVKVLVNLIARLDIDAEVRDFKAGEATEEDVKKLINMYMVTE
jgi:VCBS repeat-containing protein